MIILHPSGLFYKLVVTPRRDRFPVPPAIVKAPRSRRNRRLRPSITTAVTTSDARSLNKRRNITKIHCQREVSFIQENINY